MQTIVYSTSDCTQNRLATRSVQKENRSNGMPSSGLNSSSRLPCVCRFQWSPKLAVKRWNELTVRRSGDPHGRKFIRSIWSVRKIGRCYKKKGILKNLHSKVAPRTIWVLLDLYEEGLEMSEGEGLTPPQDRDPDHSFDRALRPVGELYTYCLL